MHFGIIGRIVCTAVVIAIPAVMLRMGGISFAGGFAALWSFTVLPWALRDLWGSSKRRVRVTDLESAEHPFVQRKP